MHVLLDGAEGLSEGVGDLHVGGAAGDARLEDLFGVVGAEEALDEGGGRVFALGARRALPVV